MIEPKVKIDYDEVGDILYIFSERTSGTWMTIDGCDYLHAMIDRKTGEFLGITIMNYEALKKDIMKEDKKEESEEG